MNKLNIPQSQFLNKTTDNKSDIIPRDSLAMRLTMDPRNFDANEKKKLKEKLKILKDGIKLERELNKEIMERNQEITKKYENTILELDQKEQETIKQQNEIQKLREVLILERTQKEKYKQIAQTGDNTQINNNSQILNGQLSKSQINSSNSIMGNVSSLFGFGSHSAGMVKEQLYKDTLEQLEKMAYQKSQLEINIQDIESINLRTVQNYEEKIKFYKNNQEEKDQKIMNFKQNINELNENIQDLNNQIILLKQEKYISQQQIQELNQQILDNQENFQKYNECKENLNQKQIEILDLKQYQQKIEEQLNEQIKKNQILQNQIVESNNIPKTEIQKKNDDSKYLFFELEKLNGLSNFKIQLTCRIDIEGDYIMELLSLTQCYFIVCQDVMDIEIFQNPPTIQIKHRLDNKSKVHQLRCKQEDLIKISQQLKDFRQKAPRTKKQSQLQEKGKQNGFMEGMFSMFKN